MSTRLKEYGEDWHREMRADPRTHYAALPAGSLTFPYQVGGTRDIGEPGISAGLFRTQAEAEAEAARLDRPPERTQSTR